MNSCAMFFPPRGRKMPVDCPCRLSLSVALAEACRLSLSFAPDCGTGNAAGAGGCKKACFKGPLLLQSGQQYGKSRPMTTPHLVETGGPYRALRGLCRACRKPVFRGLSFGSSCGLPCRRVSKRRCQAAGTGACHAEDDGTARRHGPAERPPLHRVWAPMSNFPARSRRPQEEREEEQHEEGRPQFPFFGKSRPAPRIRFLERSCSSSGVGRAVFWCFRPVRQGGTGQP